MQSAPTDFRKAALIEPRLLDLEADVRTARPTEAGFWRDWEAFKGRLKRLVGWRAVEPRLASSDAYELAAKHLLGLFENGDRG